MHGKARYSQIRRYSQIQNLLASRFKRPLVRRFKLPGEGGFPYIKRGGEGGGGTYWGGDLNFLAREVFHTYKERGTLLARRFKLPGEGGFPYI